MDGSIVFRTTQDGQSELEQPQRGLGTLARQLLILIDGKRSVADLGLLLSGHGDIAPVLLELLGAGLITTAVQGAAAPPPALDARAAAAANPAAAVPSPAAVLPPGAETWPGVVPGQYPGQQQPVPAQQPAPPLAAVPQAPQFPQPAAGQVSSDRGTWPGVAQPGQVPQAPVQAPPPQQAAPQAPAADPMTLDRLEQAKRAILREIREIFGRDADPVAEKLRGCQDLQELAMLVTRVREITVGYAGREAADEFMHTAKRLLQQAR
ncbi:MAG: hypothetical protein AAF725_12230 [Acidobacteriota bacterium]